MGALQNIGIIVGIIIFLGGIGIVNFALQQPKLIAGQYLIIGIILIIIGIAISMKGTGIFDKDKKTKEENQEKENPIDILKKRYAKGEITKEEYDKMKEDLE